MLIKRKRRIKSRSLSKIKNRKKSMYIVIALIVILVTAFLLTPFLTAYVVDLQNNGKWDTIKETETVINNSTETTNITVDNSNVNINTTYNREYNIHDNSYLDYKGQKSFSFGVISIDLQKDKWGNPYYIDSSQLKIVVTDDNNTPISDINLIVSVSFVDNFWWNFWTGNHVLMDNTEIICNQGDNSNVYDFGNPDKFIWADCHKSINVQISLTETDLQKYSDFVSTDAISVQNCAIIYIRLIDGNKHLLKMQSELKSDGAVNDIVNSNSYLFKSEGKFNEPSGTTKIHALDTTNLTGLDYNFYKPKLSVYTNNVLKIDETRFIKTETPIPDSAGYYFTYRFWDYYNVEIYPEVLVNSVTITNINNESYNFVAGNYYNVHTTLFLNLGQFLIINPSYCVYLFQLGIVWKVNLNVDIPLGRTLCAFNYSSYVIDIKYYYNNYYSQFAKQIVHRQIFNDNFRLNMLCDFNSPLYLNGTKSYFTFRYMLVCNDSDYILKNINSGVDIPYSFHLWAEILDKEDVQLFTVYKTVSINRNQIGNSLPITFDLKNIDLKDITSYKINVWFDSLDNGQWSRNSAIYSHALYYVFHNFDEFLSDVEQMDNLINSIKEQSDVTDGTYSSVKDLIGVMKYKIGNLEGATKELKSNNPDRNYDQYNAVINSIDNFKFYTVSIYALMAEYSAKDINYGEFKHYLSCLNYWYSDSFSQYNNYIAGLKGETQITQDFNNISFGIRDVYTQKWVTDRNKDYLNFIPIPVLIFALLISILIAVISYLKLKDRIKKKWILYIGVILMFIISFALMYILISAISTQILYWYYGV